MRSTSEGEDMGVKGKEGWAGSHCNKLKQAMGEFPVCVIDLSQGALVCFVQRHW
jgi:hypothetical protein